MADAPSPDLFAGHAPVTVLAICPRMVTSVNLPANRMRSSPLPHELCHVPSVSSCRSRCLLARGRIVGRGPVRVNRRLDSLALGNEEAFREARCGHSGTSPTGPRLPSATEHPCEDPGTAIPNPPAICAKQIEIPTAEGRRVFDELTSTHEHTLAIGGRGRWSCASRSDQYRLQDGLAPWQPTTPSEGFTLLEGHACVDSRCHAAPDAGGRVSGPFVFEEVLLGGIRHGCDCSPSNAHAKAGSACAAGDPESSLAKAKGFRDHHGAVGIGPATKANGRP